MKFHLKWTTLLATGLKNLAEVFDKGDGVVDRLGEGVDLSPVGACDNGNPLLLYNLPLAQYQDPSILVKSNLTTLRVFQGLQEAYYAEQRLSCTFSAAGNIFQLMMVLHQSAEET